MSILEWTELGIPEGYGDPRLLYNPPSATLIVEVHPVGKAFLPSQIYFRHKDSVMYEPIRKPEPMVSCQSAVTSQGRPFLFYQSTKWVKQEDCYTGGDRGVYRFDILNRTHAEIVADDSLSIPAPYNRGWVSNLVAASEDASTLVLTIGMSVEDNTLGFHGAPYHLACMDLATKQLEFISQLKSAFL